MKHPDVIQYACRDPETASQPTKWNAPSAGASQTHALRAMPGSALMKSLLGLLLLISLSCPATAGQLEPYQGNGQTPAISLQDLGHKIHDLADYRGSVVLVNFWASWCGPCVKEIPSLQRLQETMNGKPFILLAVNEQEAPGTVWKFANRFGIHFPLLLDRDGKTAFDWGIDIYPTSFLIDPRGRIRYVAYGPRDWDNPEIIQTIENMK
jgi:thiol-disulfide isomerase/thioredoxin